MATGPDQHRLTPAERSNLVAYLDGELNEAETQAISTKLTRSVTARRELEALEKTWELLDHLPRPQLSPDFTVRTLTEVKQISLAGEEFESKLKQSALRAIRASVWVLASLVVLALGFTLTHWVWPNPTARLARDLSIAEHLDEYRDVGNFEFLDAIAHSPEFGTEPD